MSIKTKVALGVVFLFAVILTIGGIGLYYLNELSADSQNIIKNNYESLHYMKNILGLAEKRNVSALDSMERYLSKQELNVTEPNERELTIQLRSSFEGYKKDLTDSLARTRLRQTAVTIQEVNLQAIIRKNEVAQRTASRASTYVIIVVTIFSIIAFTFIVNFPGYVANPIIQLTNSIKSIANKNYEERLHFDRKDEFEELAEAFNQMAEKMDEYEHSNLSKVMFEKKRIETIINRMTDPVIGLDEHKKVVFANDQALTFLNLSKEQLIGRYAPDAAVENDLLRNLIRNETTESDSKVIKIVFAGKENYFSKENILIRHTPTGEKNEEMIGQVILLKNITPYKELDLAKTNFIATISHELKTPIASIQMCTQLLQDKRIGVLNTEQHGIVKTLSDEIVRLSKITNELLDLSQVESGNLKLNIKATAASDIIGYALEAVKFQAERKQIKIEVQSPDQPALQADVDKTTWVLVNLLTNAIRYSPENDRIQLKCVEENESVIFSVSDSGPGIEEKYMGKLFGKFYQVPGTPSGTGLGLAISKEFIEAQGGNISVMSETGKGSTFSFRLKKV